LTHFAAAHSHSWDAKI